MSDKSTGFKTHHFKSADPDAAALFTGTFDDQPKRFYASTAWANLEPIMQSTYLNIIARLRVGHGRRHAAMASLQSKLARVCQIIAAPVEQHHG